ncbi:2-hydroxyacid dehydrogenase [Microbispora sp. NPDC049125]|uniref:2-hydroxyacid dehydrogenase n=1 Tax=Microbispora sp. NPDC049125 TaxID=3154929 RepID=UPI0034678DC1
MSQTAATRHSPDRHLAESGAGDEPAAARGTILVTGTGIDLSLLEPLKLSHGLVPHPVSEHLSEEQLAYELRDVVAYVHGGEERATAQALGKAGKLKVVAFLGVGYENFVDVAAADALGIVVTNTGGAATESVATFTVGQIINANWRITHSLRDPHHPLWHGPEDLPHELRTRTVGIVGMGAIGTRIAEIMTQAFGARVVYFSRTPKRDVERRLGLEFLPLHELAEKSDILVVMVPETDQTRGMIDADVLTRVRKGAILVNTARPAVVDPEALHDALRKETVALAVFDGFYGRDSGAGGRLLDDFGDRLLVTGHIASHTREAMDRMVGRAVRSVANVLSNGADEHAVGSHGGPDADRPVKASSRPGGWKLFRSVPESLRLGALIQASWYRGKRQPAARRTQP